jgi:hypothetical protein
MTDARYQAVLDNIMEHGLSDRQACEASGVPHSTFCYYRDNPKAIDHIDRIDRYQHADDIRQARLLAIAQEIPAMLLDKILKAITEAQARGEMPIPEWRDLTSSAKVYLDWIKWYLAIANPAKYSLTHKTELSGKDGAPLPGVGVGILNVTIPATHDEAYLAELAKCLGTAKLDELKHDLDAINDDTPIPDNI